LPLAERVPFAPAALLAAKVLWTPKGRRGPPKNLDESIAPRWEQLRRDGVTVVDGFLIPEICARLRDEIDDCFAAYPSAIHEDAQKADQRLYLNAPPGELGPIYSDKRLMDCATAYLGAEAYNLAILAARLKAVPGNLGSGGGWHRDAFAGQVKAVLYLNDVGEDNGPFQYLRASHRLRAMIADRRCARLGIAQTRLSEEQIQTLLDGDPTRLITATGSAGTLILTDTTGLHRGMPIRAGTRYALTNYYFARNVRRAEMAERFKLIVGVHVAYERAASTSMDSV
ncbi:MAG: phytanoyl-CoA dioxygenase family protein, partial [Parvibaculaceae bacterium]